MRRLIACALVVVALSFSGCTCGQKPAAVDGGAPAVTEDSGTAPETDGGESHEDGGEPLDAGLAGRTQLEVVPGAARMSGGSFQVDGQLMRPIGSGKVTGGTFSVEGAASVNP